MKREAVAELQSKEPAGEIERDERERDERERDERERDEREEREDRERERGRDHHRHHRPEGPEAKIHHLMQAAEHLELAGLEDEAEEVRAMAEEVREELEARSQAGAPRDGRNSSESQNASRNRAATPKRKRGRSGKRSKA